MKRVEYSIPLNGVTATTTSSPVSIEVANRVTLMFKRANHSSGSSAFTVDVSVDGVNWVGYNKLIDNVTNTNGQMLTRVATVTLSSDTAKVYSLDLQHDTYRWMRITVTETTDGTHTATALVEYNV